MDIRFPIIYTTKSGFGLACLLVCAVYFTEQHATGLPLASCLLRNAQCRFGFSSFLKYAPLRSGFESLPHYDSGGVLLKLSLLYFDAPADYTGLSDLELLATLMTAAPRCERDMLAFCCAVLAGVPVVVDLFRIPACILLDWDFFFAVVSFEAA